MVTNEWKKKKKAAVCESYAVVQPQQLSNYSVISAKLWRFTGIKSAT